MSVERGPHIVLATIVARTETADEVATMLRAYASVVRAEPGNLVFVPRRVIDDPRSFVVYEEYRDEEAFAAHLASPANTEFNERLESLVEGGGSTLSFLSAL
jgi:quinol monooxygenase YgiN